LIAKRDVISLGTKYETQLFERPYSRLSWWHYIREAGWTKVPRGPIEEYQPVKQFDDFAITARRTTFFSGHDPQNDYSIEYFSKMNKLHIENIRGAQHLRQQLGTIAAYTCLHSELHLAETIGDVTHPAMGSFLRRLGFHALELDKVSEPLKAEVYALHQAFRVVNGKPFDPIPYDDFQPVGVYMTNNEFIERFSDPRKIWMGTP
jgi:hypothetical protein